MEQAFIGNIKISGKDCPFSYEKENEKIIVYTGSKNIEIPDGMDIIVGQKYGMMSGGYVLYKLSTPLSNDCLCIGGGAGKYISISNQIRSVDFYIEDYQLNSKYTEMKLQFPELNYFIPSVGRMTVSDEQISFSRIKDSLCVFDFKYHGVDIRISFDTKMGCHSCVNATAETISEVSLVFPETEDLNFLWGLYHVVRCFFAFICNRQNIGLRSAVLIGSYPRKRIKDRKIVDSVGYTSQNMVFSQKYLEHEEKKAQIAKTPKIGLFLDNLPKLFHLFTEESADSIATINGNEIHHSIKYRNLIDLEQSLHITATFEYYVRTLLPEMSSASTIAFFNDLGVLLDEYIANNSGKKKQKAQKFKKGLIPQIALESKVQKAYGGYSTWKPLKPILSEWFGDDITAMASAANSWRNELAHEKRAYQPTVDVINAMRLIEHINYCIILRRAGYGDEQIKAIVSEILTR